MLSTVLYYELAMKVPIPVGITVYLLTWGLGHLRCLVLLVSPLIFLAGNIYQNTSLITNQALIRALLLTFLQFAVFVVKT